MRSSGDAIRDLLGERDVLLLAAAPASATRSAAHAILEWRRAAPRSTSSTGSTRRRPPARRRCARRSSSSSTARRARRGLRSRSTAPEGVHRGLRAARVGEAAGDVHRTDERHRWLPRPSAAKLVWHLPAGAGGTSASPRDGSAASTPSTASGGVAEGLGGLPEVRDQAEVYVSARDDPRVHSFRSRAWRPSPGAPPLCIARRRDPPRPPRAVRRQVRPLGACSDGRQGVARLRRPRQGAAARRTSRPPGPPRAPRLRHGGARRRARHRALVGAGARARLRGGEGNLQRVLERISLEGQKLPGARA